MLRSQLGDELYRQCIKTYLERNAFSSVVTEELNEVFEEVTGRSLDPFFDQWVYHARHPDLTVTYKWLPVEKLAHVTVKQTQTANDSVLLFRFPTKLRFIFDDHQEIIDHEIEIDSVEHEFYVPLPDQPSIVRFDPEYTVLANITFEKPEHMQLAQLENTQDMIGRILAVRGLGKRKTNKGIAALKKTLNEDPFYGVRLEASRTLQRINSDAAFAALRDSLRQDDARVRQRVTSDIGKFVRDETADILSGVIENERNPAIRASAIKAFGRYANEDSRDQLVALLNTDSFGNEIADAAIEAMRRQDDPWYANKIKIALQERESAFYGRSMSSALSAVAWLSRHKKSQDKTRQLLAAYLSHPKETVRLAAIRAFGDLGDLRATALLEPLADADLSSRVKDAAESSLRRLRASTPPVPQEVRDLRERLDSLEDEYEKLRKKLEAIDGKQQANQANEQVEGRAKASQ
jgi:aminopeptidase N